MDLIIQLSPENIATAFAAFASLGYHPMVPVTAEQFADPAQRRQWITDKHMMVLNFQSDLHRETPVDIFTTEPFDFDIEYRTAREQQLAIGLFVRFVSIPTLIAMKEVANRPRDADDIQHLRWLVEEQRENYPNT